MPDATIHIPLCLEALQSSGHDVVRSGFRWLCDDGHVCRAGEVIASCFLRLFRQEGVSGPSNSFAEERSRVQVLLAPRLPGRLIQENQVQGGYVDLLPFQQRWSEATQIGTLECNAADVSACAGPPFRLRMLMLQSHEAAIDGFAAQAHRAWWTDGAGELRSILSAGNCEQLGVFWGERHSFVELFELVPGPIHISFVPLQVVPSASVLAAQLCLTPLDRRAMLADLAARLGPLLAARSTGESTEFTDWSFAGQLMRALCRCPMVERHEVLTVKGVQTLDPPAAVVLSLNSELAFHFRHKRLGYPLSLHPYQLSPMGPALLEWLREDFDAIRKSPADIERDYRALLDLVASRTAAHVLIFNSVSAAGADDCICYAPFDKPLAETLGHIHTQEMNLMLYELARARDISVVDMDTLTIEHGGRHSPDAIHADGHLLHAIRTQIAFILQERGIIP
jgi:hypothetical protein